MICIRSNSRTQLRRHSLISGQLVPEIPSMMIIVLQIDHHYCRVAHRFLVFDECDALKLTALNIDYSQIARLVLHAYIIADRCLSFSGGALT